MVLNLQPIHVKTGANALCMAGDEPGCEHRGKAGWGGGTQGFPHATNPIIWEGFPDPKQKRDAGECTEDTKNQSALEPLVQHGELRASPWGLRYF